MLSSKPVRPDRADPYLAATEAADDDIARAGLASIGEAEQFTAADAP